MTRKDEKRHRTSHQQTYWAAVTLIYCSSFRLTLFILHQRSVRKTTSSSTLRSIASPIDPPKTRRQWCTTEVSWTLPRDRFNSTNVQTKSQRSSSTLARTPPEQDTQGKTARESSAHPSTATPTRRPLRRTEQRMAPMEQKVQPRLVETRWR